jgi:hypothetical protein
MTRSEKDKMLVGELYDPSAAEIRSDQAATTGRATIYGNPTGIK